MKMSFWKIDFHDFGRLMKKDFIYPTSFLSHFFPVLKSIDTIINQGNLEGVDVGDFFFEFFNKRIEIKSILMIE